MTLLYGMEYALLYLKMLRKSYRIKPDYCDVLQTVLRAAMERGAESSFD